MSNALQSLWETKGAMLWGARGAWGAEGAWGVQGSWGARGVLPGPRRAPLCHRPEDPALQLLAEAAHLPPVHRPRPARQPGGGHRLVSAAGAAGLPSPPCAVLSVDVVAAAHGGCEDARRMVFLTPAV